MGYCSRSSAADLIRAGRVGLNGTIRLDPETPVDQNHAAIAVDGTVVKPEEKIYLMLNKPRGIVTTASDDVGRETVYDILPKIDRWVAPVGRLDKATEGLLLLTNDSNWAAKIAAPETHLDKTYHVQVDRIADDSVLQNFVMGVKADNGELLRAKRAVVLRTGQKNCWLEMVLDEGKNRQIRRMMQGLGFEVLRLVRVAVGPLQLGDLPKGTHRPLSRDEKLSLDQAMRQRI
jgi:23S rRNA pseudouridine2605 synthase